MTAHSDLLQACQQHLFEAGQAGLAQGLRQFAAEHDDLVATLRGILEILPVCPRSAGMGGIEARYNAAVVAARAALAKAGAP